MRAVEGLIARVEQYAQQPWDLMSNLPTFRSEPIDPADLVMVKADDLRAALATPEPTVQAWPQEDVHTPPINPDCAAGNKHRACAGDAWDETTDSPTTCACECHAEVSR